LPPKTEVECYSVTKIIQSRSKLSTVEKINLLIKLENALIDKYKKLHGKKRDIKKADKKASQEVKPMQEVPKTSELDEDEG